MIPLKYKNTLNTVGAQVQRPFSFLPSLLLIVAAVFFLPGIVRKWYNRYKAQKDTSDVINGSVVVPDNVYRQGSTTINLPVIAKAIYSAIYNNDWFGASEDEDEMIRQIKKVPKNMIPQLASEYAKITDKGRSLYDEYIKYIDMDDLQESGVYDLINQ